MSVRIPCWQKAFFSHYSELVFLPEFATELLSVLETVTNMLNATKINKQKLNPVWGQPTVPRAQPHHTELEAKQNTECNWNSSFLSSTFIISIHFNIEFAPLPRLHHH